MRAKGILGYEPGKRFVPKANKDNDYIIDSQAQQDKRRIGRLGFRDARRIVARKHGDYPGTTAKRNCFRGRKKKTRAIVRLDACLYEAATALTVKSPTSRDRCRTSSGSVCGRSSERPEAQEWAFITPGRERSADLLPSASTTSVIISIKRRPASRGIRCKFKIRTRSPD